MGEAGHPPAGLESIRDVRDDETVGDEYTVRGDPATIESLLDQFRSLGLHPEIEEDTYEGNERVVRFVEVADLSRDIAHYLSGGVVDE